MIMRVRTPQDAREYNRLTEAQRQAEQAIQDREDYEFASKKARQYMKGLFDGVISVRCRHCHEKISFRKGKFECQQCQCYHNRIEYEDDYMDKIIKTVIDVNKRTFTLQQLRYDEL